MAHCFKLYYFFSLIKTVPFADCRNYVIKTFEISTYIVKLDVMSTSVF